MNILMIEELRLGFDTPAGTKEVVRGVDLTVEAGERIGILGESGSGKSVTMKSVLKVPEEKIIQLGGTVVFNGQSLQTYGDRQMRALRGRDIGYIPQHASDALDPYRTVWKQMADFARHHGKVLTREDAASALTDVGITEPELTLSMYPQKLSGGQAQRVAIAMGILLSPKLIIADEPTSAIDASLKKMVLDLLKKINQEKGISLVVITHDFDVVRYLCERVYVMYGGLIMEEGVASEMVEEPSHPYTQELIACVRSIESAETGYYAIPGRANAHVEKDACPFSDRCARAFTPCMESVPPVKTIGDRKVRCFLYA